MWKIKKVSDGYVVQFPNLPAMKFLTRAQALAYINDRALSDLGF